MGDEDFEVNSMYKLIYLCVFSLNNIEDKDQKIGPNGETVNDYIKIIKEYHSTEKFDDNELPFEFISEQDFSREHIRLMVRGQNDINIKSSNTSRAVLINGRAFDINIFFTGYQQLTIYRFGHGSTNKKVNLKSKKRFTDSELLDVTKLIAPKLFN